MVFASPQQERLIQASGVFEFAGTQLSELCNRVVPEKRIRNGILHIGGHGLHRFFADRGKMAAFVDHPATLTTHAEGTSLARIFGTQGLIEFPESSGLASFSHRIADSEPSATTFDSSCHDSATVTVLSSR